MLKRSGSISMFILVLLFLGDSAFGAKRSEHPTNEEASDSEAKRSRIELRIDQLANVNTDLGIEQRFSLANSFLLGQDLAESFNGHFFYRELDSIAHLSRESNPAASARANILLARLIFEQRLDFLNDFQNYNVFLGLRRAFSAFSFSSHENTTETTDTTENDLAAQLRIEMANFDFEQILPEAQIRYMRPLILRELEAVIGAYSAGTEHGSMARILFTLFALSSDYATVNQSRSTEDIRDLLLEIIKHFDITHYVGYQARFLYAQIVVDWLPASSSSAIDFERSHYFLTNIQKRFSIDQSIVLRAHELHINLYVRRGLDMDTETFAFIRDNTNLLLEHYNESEEELTIVRNFLCLLSGLSQASVNTSTVLVDPLLEAMNPRLRLDLISFRALSSSNLRQEDLISTVDRALVLLTRHPEHAISLELRIELARYRLLDRIAEEQLTLQEAVIFLRTAADEMPSSHALRFLVIDLLSYAYLNAGVREGLSAAYLLDLLNSVREGEYSHRVEILISDISRALSLRENSNFNQQTTVSLTLPLLYPGVTGLVLPKAFSLLSMPFSF